MLEFGGRRIAEFVILKISNGITIISNLVNTNPIFEKANRRICNFKILNRGVTRHTQFCKEEADFCNWCKIGRRARTGFPTHIDTTTHLT